VHVTSDAICQLAPHETGSLLGDKAISTLFDNNKIKQLVPNFKAVIPYAEGIKKTLAWFEADENRQVIDAEEEALIEQLVKLTKT
jgi:hypothetical protein